MASRGRARRFWRHPATAAGLALLGLLLFLWPFVRQPRPGLARAWVELMAAWALGVIALHRVSRRRDPGAPEAGRDG
ncbi:MAG: hypothetical protein HZB56_14615 [Deltaproteobacteria bacterium]|nr:hypothetical protein [Deltaproteobacteria bacterium]